MARIESVDVIYVRSRGQGWGPVDALANLTARLVSTNGLTIIDDAGRIAPWRKALTFVPPVRRRGRAALLIVSNPAQLGQACGASHWLPGYETVGAWVIDSFWTEWTSRIARARRPQHIDHLFITDGDLMDEWASITPAEVAWAPWGSDTLAAASTVGWRRPVDVLRLGRQPPVWDDDHALVLDAARLGLAAAGRPPISQLGMENQAVVRSALLAAKTTLAFSNSVNPEKYTHPSREYVTGRWCDALAAGSTVVGVAPHCRTTREVLWEGATVEIPHDDRGRGLAVIKEYLAEWTPEVARRQQALARQRLDWRHRLDLIVRTMGLPVLPDLERELSQLVEA